MNTNCIRESVDSLCRDGADAQYIQYRAGADYFRVVRPLHALKCEQARGVWGHAPPGKFFKIRHSEIASEAMFGAKKVLESPHL